MDTGTPELAITLQDMTGIGYDENEIYIIINKSGMEFSISVTKEQLTQIFPNIIKYEDGQLGLTTQDRQGFLPIDKNDKKLLNMLGVAEVLVESLERNTKDNKYYDIVNAAGFKDEYCLLFGDRILFHSKSKDETDAYKAQHSYLGFSEYIPNSLG